jgi:adenine C2-methylase RlmN of 23S rRNA A2503 and tRNA A37
VTSSSLSPSQVALVTHVLKLRVVNVVFMGMGEPLDNLDAVITAVSEIESRAKYRGGVGDWAAY